MKTIAQAIQQASRTPQNTPSSSLPAPASPEERLWVQKWNGPSDVEKQFNPVHWGYTLSNPDRAYMASCPTLAAYDRLFGEGCAEDWICTQITVLFAASSSREKGLADGIRLFSSAFAAEVRQYKLSELMLFFARYKAGKYDNSYASFDAKRIGNAFFKEFLKERVYEIDRVERAKVQQQIEDRRFVAPEGHTSYSWYQELKKRALAGDKEAASQLKKPFTNQ